MEHNTKLLQHQHTNPSSLSTDTLTHGPKDTYFTYNTNPSSKNHVIHTPQTPPQENSHLSLKLYLKITFFPLSDHRSPSTPGTSTRHAALNNSQQIDPNK